MRHGRGPAEDCSPPEKRRTTGNLVQRFAHNVGVHTPVDYKETQARIRYALDVNSEPAAAAALAHKKVYPCEIEGTD